MRTAINHGREWHDAGTKDGFHAPHVDEGLDEPQSILPGAEAPQDSDSPSERRGLLHYILDPDDWLGRHPAVCGVLLVLAYFFVGWLDWVLA